MSEYVQALELRIQDNANEAVGGLGKLADSLRAIKEALSGGIGLAGAASQIKKFSENIAAASTTENIAALNKLASAIGRIATNVQQLSGLSDTFAAVRRAMNAGSGSRSSGSAGASGSAAANASAGLAEAAGEARSSAQEIADAATSGTAGVSEIRNTLENLMDAVDAAVSRSGSIEELNSRIASLKQALAQNLSSGKIKEDTEAFYKATAAIARLVAQRDKLEESMKRDAEAAHSVDIDSSSIEQADDAAKALTSDIREAASVASELAITSENWTGPRAYGGTSTIGSSIGPNPPEDLSKLGADAAFRARQEAEAKKELELSSGAAEKLGEAFLTANGKLGLLAMQIKVMKENLGRGIASGKMDLKQQATLGQQIQNAEEKLLKMRESMTAVKKEAELTAQAAMSIGRAFVDANGKAGLIAMEIQDKEAQLGAAVASGQASQTQMSRAGQEILRLREKLDKVSGAHEEAESAAESHGSALKRFANAVWGANGGLLGLLTSMMRMARYRMFRSLIRHITEGFSTGLQNVREYSKAINGLYARDMQGLDNSLLKMKNSLGASLAAALRSLIPLFQQLTSWVITAANYINQFFALINGQSTWTRAVEVEADALEETEDAANGAGKAMKNLLASWDELNIIQSKGGGGAGGIGTEDAEEYLNMFEEVSAFDSRVRDLVTWLENHLPEVYSILGGIGASLLGFKLPAAITIAGAIWSFEEGLQSGKNGDTFLQSLYDNLPSMLVTALGGAAIGYSVTKSMSGLLVGLTVGAAISVFANSIGFLQGKHEADTNADAFARDVSEVVSWALGGALLGLGISMVAGGGMKGALFGMSIGASVGIFLASIFQSQRETADVEGDFASRVLSNSLTILSGAIGMGLVGLRVSKSLVGGLIGFTIGAVAMVAIQEISYDQARRARQREQYQKVYQEILKDLRDNLGSYLYAVDISVTTSAIHSRSSDMRRLDGDIQTAVQSLNGRYRVMVGVGLDEATEDDYAAMLADVNTIVSTLQERFDTQEQMINIGIGLVPEGGDSETTDLLTGAVEALTVPEAVVRGLGTSIGRILSDGVVDEFEMQSLPRMLEALNTMTTIITQAQRTAEYNTNMQEFRRTQGENWGTAASYQALLDWHAEQLEDAREAAVEVYTQGEAAYRAQRDTYEEMLAHPERYEGINIEATEQLLADSQATLDAYLERRDQTIEDIFNGIIGDDSAFYDLLDDLLGTASQRLFGAGIGERANAITWHAATGNAFTVTPRDVTRALAVEIFNMSDESPGNLESKYMGGGQYATYVTDLSAGPLESVRTRMNSTTYDDYRDVFSRYLRQYSTTPLHALQEYEAAREQAAAMSEAAEAMEDAADAITTGPGYGVFQSTPGGANGRPSMDELLQMMPGNGGGGGAPLGFTSGEADVGVYGNNYGTVYVGGGGGAPGVESGENESEADQERNDILTQMLGFVRQIAGKDFSVEVRPTAAWGKHNAESDRLFASAKG